MNKVTIMTFTDPMMGLSYESEPVFRKLETHFDEIEFKFLMSVLVKNVYDLVDPADLSVSKEFALKNYNARLAEIYKSEEAMSGLPINMRGFQLFSVNETSSLPLNLAYKAAQLTCVAKADEFLYRLRYATIVECRPTTKLDEILKVVRAVGIDEEKFLVHYNSGNAEKTLQEDLNFAYKLGIHTLPSYVVEYNGEGALFQELIGYNQFVKIIYTLTKGAVKPKVPEKSVASLKKFFDKHPLISPIEIREAYDFSNVAEVMEFIAPLIESNDVEIIDVERGQFLKKVIK